MKKLVKQNNYEIPVWKGHKNYEKISHLLGTTAIWLSATQNDPDTFWTAFLRKLGLVCARLCGLADSQTQTAQRLVVTL